jgi:ribonuclease Z
MYLCRPRPYADLKIQRVSSRLLPDCAQFRLRFRRIRERTPTARSLSTVPGQTDEEASILYTKRYRYDRIAKTHRGTLASAAGDGSWSSGDLGPGERGSVSSRSRSSQRTPTLRAAKRRFSRMPVTGLTREKFYFQVITTPTSDTVGTSLLLHFDSKRYIFGHVSEGTQRACIQRGISLKKVKNIFLSGRVEWKYTGGLIGMILTLADTQAAERQSEKIRSVTTGFVTTVPPLLEDCSEQGGTSADGSLTIHGGENLMHTLACARGFVFRKGMPIHVKEFERSDAPHLEKPTWSDENIQVWAMPIIPSSSTTIDTDDTETSDADITSPGNKRRKRSHDQSEGEIETGITTNSPDQHLQHQELRQKIVSEMFDSNWNRDALIETPLADVKMPAALFVRDPGTKKIVKYDGPKPGDAEALPNIQVLVRKPWPGALIQDLPPIQDVDHKIAMSYIVQGYPQRGTFDPTKAKALGVPKGPLYSALAAGNSVTLNNGTIATPEMVLGPTKPGRGIAIIDLPAKKYVASLISRPEWAFEDIRSGITAICWILGPGVVGSPELQKFMDSMPGVEHVVSSRDVNPNYLALDSSAASAIRLSRVCNTYFPVPIHDNLTVPQLPLLHTKPQLHSSIIAAERGLKIQVQPKFLINKDQVPPFLNTAEIVRNLPQKVQDYATLAREQLASEVADASDAERNRSSSFDPEIITLGTGSALPSKYRNVSATLLRTEKYGNFLFDCGENTLGQLKRMFDGPTLSEVLRNLKLIWLSHLHADHHLGTVSILIAQKHALRSETQRSKHQNAHEVPGPLPRLVVASSSKMLRFFEEYGRNESLGDIQYLFCHGNEISLVDNSLGKTKSMLQQLGIKFFRTTAVEHCSGAQAISITFANDFKFSYSGDCRPSASFAKIGQGSDVLVHEATFDDDMEGDALAKKHCTIGEALGVAAKMEAKNVILTHFSQRYQKLPVMENVKLPSTPNATSQSDIEEPPAFLGELGETGDVFPSFDSKLTGGSKTLFRMTSPNPSITPSPHLKMNLCVAFDYMRVRVSDVKHMKKFTPALAALFEAEQAKQLNEPAPQTDNETSNQKSRRYQRSTSPHKNMSRNSNLDVEISQGSYDSERKPNEEQKGQPKRMSKQEGALILQGSTCPDS